MLTLYKDVFAKAPKIILLTLILALATVNMGRAASESIELSGRLNAYYVDRLHDHSSQQSYIHYQLIQDDGSKTRLYFEDEPRKLDLKQNKKIRIKGRKGNKGIRISDYRFEELKPGLRFSLKNADPQDAIGQQRILIVPIRDSKLSGNHFLLDRETLQRYYFSNSGPSLQSYLHEVSKGQTFITGRVLNPIDVPNLCRGGNILADGGETKALNAIIKKVNIENFDRISFIVPEDDRCIEFGVAGFGSVGLASIVFDDGSRLPISVSFVKSHRATSGADFRVISTIIHEFGHNLGLKHDNGNVCGRRLFNEECPSLEYGGAHSIMGLSPTLSHFNTIHQEDLGWMNNSEIITLEPNSTIDESFEISPLAANNGIKAVKIPRGDGSYYVVEYRQPVNSDAIKTHPLLNVRYRGLLIYLNNDRYHNDSILFERHLNDQSSDLEFNPSSASYFNSDLAIDFNSLGLFDNDFYDPVNNIRIIPESFTGQKAKFRVVTGSNSNDDSAVSASAGDGDVWSFISQVESLTNRPTWFNISKGQSPFDDNVKQYQWDFDGDGDIDKITTKIGYTTHRYSEPGDYTASVTVILNNNESLNFSTNVSIKALLQTDLEPQAISIASGSNTASLSIDDKTPYILNITNNSNSRLKIKFKIDRRYFKLIKFRKGKLRIPGLRTKGIKVILAAESKINQVMPVNEDGYYEIPLVLVESDGVGNKSRITEILRVKSSL